MNTEKPRAAMRAANTEAPFSRRRMEGRAPLAGARPFENCSFKNKNMIPQAYASALPNAAATACMMPLLL
jgi:hypothetical protein